MREARFIEKIFSSGLEYSLEQLLQTFSDHFHFAALQSNSFSLSDSVEIFLRPADDYPQLLLRPAWHSIRHICVSLKDAAAETATVSQINETSHLQIQPQQHTVLVVTTLPDNPRVICAGVECRPVKLFNQPEKLVRESRLERKITRVRPDIRSLGQMLTLDFGQQRGQFLRFAHAPADFRFELLVLRSIQLHADEPCHQFEPNLCRLRLQGNRDS